MTDRTIRFRFRKAGLSAAGAAALTVAVPTFAFPTVVEARTDYRGGIDVRTAAQTAAPRDTVTGRVFHDVSRDGIHQDGETGVRGVLVSNGREVVVTDGQGRYSLPAFDNMTVFVTEPAGWDVPLNDDLVPQFFYHHKPEGTPEPLRYGGLPATGPLPEAINFPLVRGADDDAFRCVVMGDTQPYSNTEVGYVRDSVVDDLLSRDLSDAQCMILVGDVMGDDLSLLPRFMDMMSVVGLPQYYIHGNHDYDFDATDDAHSADSWRRMYGPNYYSFEIGDVFFIALDNVVYPCGPADDGPGGRDACLDTADPTYNGRVTDQQMIWLENTLAQVPRDKLIVLAHHIPFVSFIDSNTGRHQTDNLAEIFALIGDRPALSLSGHTHTLEQLAAGEWYRGWEEQVGVTRLPFDHVVTGAPSGNWWQGDFNFDGIPMAFARGGTPPGHLVFDFDGADYRSTFHAANQPPDRQMALSFNTPGFRDWFQDIWTWMDENGRGFDGVPPVTVNDLPDVKLFTPDELNQTVYLTANFWNGDRHSRLTARIGDGPALPMTRTQDGNGEDIRSGAGYADPFAAQRQLTIGRYAYQSASGDPRTQGVEIWQGSQFGPVPPQGMSASHVADSSTHLWRVAMPADLPVGAHVATVTATDRWGRTFEDRIVFEVRDVRPPPRWQGELWTN
ncbi:MAG: calcineurin-like phosphoesterase C-terminal domain-containing protein [Inquilinaceae bacterium]